MMSKSSELFFINMGEICIIPCKVPTFNCNFCCNEANCVVLVTIDEERRLNPTGNKWNLLPTGKNQFPKITAVGQNGDLQAFLGILQGETVQVMAVLWRFVLRFIFISNPVHEREEVKWNEINTCFYEAICYETPPATEEEIALILIIFNQIT